MVVMNGRAVKAAEKAVAVAVAAAAVTDTVAMRRQRPLPQHVAAAFRFNSGYLKGVEVKG